MSVPPRNFSVFGDGILARILNSDNATNERNVVKSARDSPPSQQPVARLQNKRPSTAIRKARGPSIKISNTKRISRSPTGKFRGTDAILADLASLDREELINTVIALKKEQNLSETTISMLRADNQRMENEISKQQRRIDKLIAPISTKNGSAIVEMRKEIEKSVLVRQLKAQIQNLRSENLSKDSRIEVLTRTQKSTQLVEVMAEKEEYFEEVQRLRNVVQECNSRIQREKKQREWDRTVARNNEADLKKEMNKLMGGYKDLLSRLSDGQSDGLGDGYETYVKLPTKPVARPASAAGSPVSKITSPRIVTARPESASSRRGGSSREEGGRDGDTAHPYKAGEVGEGRYKGRQKWFPCVITAVNADGTYAVKYDDGDVEQAMTASNFRPASGNETAKEKESKSSERAYQKNEEGFLVGNDSDKTGKSTTAAVPEKVGQSDISAQKATTTPKVDETVVKQWFKKLIKVAIRKGAATVERLFGLFDLNKDGRITVSELANVVKQMKHFENAPPAEVQELFDAMDADGSGDVSLEEFRGLVQDESQQYQESIRRRSEAKYRVGSVGDGQTWSDDKWYACRIIDMNDDGTYKLEYDFGLTEDNVPEERFCLVQEEEERPPEPRKPLFQAGNVGEGNYARESKWYPCKVMAVHSDCSYRLKYDDGDEEDHVAEECFRPYPHQSLAGSMTASPVRSKSDEEQVLAPVGSIGEGNFGGLGRWIKCYVAGTNEDGTYRLQYDDGSAEDHVAWRNFRSVKLVDVVDETLASADPLIKSSLSPRLEAGMDDFFANLTVSPDDSDAEGGAPEVGYGFVDKKQVEDDSTDMYSTDDFDN